MQRAPVSGRGDAELSPEGATERLATAKSALLGDACEVGLSVGEELHRAPNASAAKEGRRPDPAELCETGERPLT